MESKEPNKHEEKRQVDNIEDNLIEEDNQKGTEYRETDVEFKDEILNESGANKKTSKKKGIIFGLILGVLIILAGIIAYMQYSKQQAEKQTKEYKDSVELLLLQVIGSSAKAEEMINEYIHVWNEAISSEYGYNLHGEYVTDFNKALQVQNKQFKRNGSIEELKDDKEIVESFVKDLNNPTDEYENIYDLIIDLHSEYRSYVDLALEPTGSLMSYRNDTKEASDEVIDIYEEIKIRLGD